MTEIDSVWTRTCKLLETRDADGILNIALAGELDLVVADRLSSRLHQLTRERTRVRVDLS